MAHGLVNWREWGRDAFGEAERDGKLVLLDISAVWCHWCHVMDETTYSDPEVIQLINDRYIAIRVDNDERPDVNRRYNLGGWPTTAFLTPDGELLTGGTYIPPAQMRGYLNQVSDAYTNSKDQILQPGKRNEILNQREAGIRPLSQANSLQLRQGTERLGQALARQERAGNECRRNCTQAGKQDPQTPLGGLNFLGQLRIKRSLFAHVKVSGEVMD